VASIKVFPRANLLDSVNLYIQNHENTVLKTVRRSVHATMHRSCQKSAQLVKKAPFRDSLSDICDVQFLALNPSNDPSAVSGLG